MTSLTYVKVQAFWSQLINPSQLRHGLASISDKEISADGWPRWLDTVSMPPELLKTFSSLMARASRQDSRWNASCVAFMKFAVRALQIRESDVFEHQLMWDSKYHSWRLAFAFLPASRSTPPIVFNEPGWKAARHEYSKVVFRD